MVKLKHRKVKQLVIVYITKVVDMSWEWGAWESLPRRWGFLQAKQVKGVCHA